MPNPPARVTGRSIQVAVRLPTEAYEALRSRGRSIAGQIVEAVRLYLGDNAEAPAGRPAVAQRAGESARQAPE